MNPDSFKCRNNWQQNVIFYFGEFQCKSDFGGNVSGRIEETDIYELAMLHTLRIEEVEVMQSLHKDGVKILQYCTLKKQSLSLPNSPD